MKWVPDFSLRALTEKILFEYTYTTENGPAIGVGAGHGLAPGDKVFCLAGPFVKSYEKTVLGFAVRERLIPERQQGPSLFELVSWVTLGLETCETVDIVEEFIAIA